jgi:hypothetical protein
MARRVVAALLLAGALALACGAVLSGLAGAR